MTASAEPGMARESGCPQGINATVDLIGEH